MICVNTNLMIALIVIIAVLNCSLTGCGTTSPAVAENVPASTVESTQPEAPNDNVFYATVLETTSDFGGILVKPESDVLPNELVIHSASLPAVSVGDRVRVEHDGQITLSLPGQIFGATVTIV